MLGGVPGMSRTEPEGPRRQGQSHSDLSKRWAHSEDRRRGGPAAVGKGRYICIPAGGPRRSSRPMPLAGLGGPPSKLQAWSAVTGPDRELRQAPCGSTFGQCYSRPYAHYTLLGRYHWAMTTRPAKAVRPFIVWGMATSAGEPGPGGAGDAAGVRAAPGRSRAGANCHADSCCCSSDRRPKNEQ